MTGIADRLIHLLNGDVVELETEAGTIATAVDTNDHEAIGEGEEGLRWRHTIGFMPIGGDARAVDADRYRVTVEPGPDGELEVGELVAEVYVEERAGYEERAAGELTDVRKLAADD